MSHSPEGGLCDLCRHVVITVNDRGSRFVRCEYAKIDPAYPKYPRLPVRRCAAFSPHAGPDADLPPQ